MELQECPVNEGSDLKDAAEVTSTLLVDRHAASPLSLTVATNSDAGQFTSDRKQPLMVG